MLLGGDELGRTQHGNNNAWCQDNEISWYDWSLLERNADLLEWVRRLIRLRRENPVFRRAAFLVGREVRGSGLPDAWWFRLDGHKMGQRDWGQADGHVLGLFLNGEEIPSRTARGEEVVGDSFLLLFNAHHEDVTFRLPARAFGARWSHELSTAEPELAPGARSAQARERLVVKARSVVCLRRTLA
jgi:glycogen operon protein